MRNNRLKENYICEQCGKKYNPQRSSKVFRFCSRKCSSQNRHIQKMEERYQSLLDNNCNTLYNLRLIKSTLIYKLGHNCFRCKKSEWLGNDIPLEVHHKDGDALNHSIENLELLCPNCHAFTDTYKFKNKKSSRIR